MKHLRRALVGALALVAGTSSAAPVAQTAAPVQTSATTSFKAGTVMQATYPAPVDKARNHGFKISAGRETLTASKVTIPPGAVSAIDVPEKKLNATKFSTAVHTALKDRARGYAMEVRKADQVVTSQHWGYARGPQNGDKAFTPTTQMHVASVGKLIAAIATVRLLEEKGLGWDTPIGAYLPLYWNVGSNVANVTFRELMTHKTGFYGYDDDYDFQTMKRAVGSGINSPHPSSSKYANVNFSLLRVTGSILNGFAVRSAVYPPDVNDAFWDMVTIQGFALYVQNKVFAPSGVSAVVTRPTSSSALAYTGVHDVLGWDSGDTAPALAAAGFRMSVKELLDVMSTFRRKGTIVSAVKAKQALDASLGIDNIWDTKAGRVYAKNGRWHDGNNHEENSVVFFMPNGFECAVLANSDLGSGVDLRDTIMNAYLASIE